MNFGVKLSGVLTCLVQEVRTEITSLGRSSWNELGIRKGIPEKGIRTDFARLVRNLIL